MGITITGIMVSIRELIEAQRAILFQFADRLTSGLGTGRGKRGLDGGGCGKALKMPAPR
jgi:hypothetical protein